MQGVIEGRSQRWRTARRSAGKTDGGPVSPLLGRLQRGEITLDEFLCAKVEGGLQPLVHVLDSRDVAFLREWGRERLRDDPVLVALVERIARVDGSTKKKRLLKRKPVKHHG
jgi:hypothetical protein